jgi:aryl-alcohol dehydrogenase-like predicted oxidoreductase
MPLGNHYGALEVADAIKLIQAAVDQGVNSFDTSPAFGNGRAEELLAQALGSGVKDISIATRALPSTQQVSTQGFTDRSKILTWLEESLLRLKRDSIDLYYIEGLRDRTTIGRLMEAMELIRESGLIGGIGLVATNSYPVRIALKYGKVNAVLVPYNILNRPIDTEFLSFCRQTDVAVHAAEPLCRGLLAGQLHRNSAFPAGDIRTDDRRFRGDRFRTNIGLVGHLARYATQEGLSMLELSLGWVMQHPAVTTAICGAKSVAQLEELIAASRTKLKLDQILEIDFIVGGNKYQRAES